MIESYLLNHPWLPASLWVLLYTSDYYLTLWGARLCRRQGVFCFEGSYELTPEFQEDVDKQKPVSFTFIMWLLAGAIILLGTGYLPGSKEVYGGFVGFFLVIEVAIHLRHIHNIAMYRRLAGPRAGIAGHITYSRGSIYHRSAQDLAGLGFLVLLGYLLTDDSVLLGGVLSLACQSIHDVSLARRHAAPAPAADQQSGEGDAVAPLEKRTQ